MKMKTRTVSLVTSTLLVTSILLNPIAHAADSDINIKPGTTDIGSNTTIKTGDLVTYDKVNGMHKKYFIVLLMIKITIKITSY